mgnify:CR=1 FL=1
MFFQGAFFCKILTLCTVSIHERVMMVRGPQHTVNCSNRIFICLFLDPPPKVMAFLGNYVELKISRNQVSTINYESEHQPNFEVYWVGTPKGKR